MDFHGFKHQRGHRSIGQRILSGEKQGVDNWITTALSMGASFLSNRSKNKGNKAAAEIISARDKEVEEAKLALGDEQIEYILDQQAKMDAYSQPGVQHLRNVMAAPTDQLTPQQTELMHSKRRADLNTVKAAGMAGSGRTMVRVLKDANMDWQDRVVAGNRERADKAGTQLASNFFNTNMNATAQRGSTTWGKQAAYKMTGAEAEANAKTANAGNTAEMIGTIAGSALPYLKNLGSSYAA